MKRNLENFSVNLFTENKLKKYLSPEKYKEYKEVKDLKKEISNDLLNDIATILKSWAISNGATHFTHWFQPLNDTTAEKHESFLNYDSKLNHIANFSGKELLKGEADASSFPNGNLRKTYNSRGYTLWDIDSPCFIKGEGSNKTLYIPAMFISYNGESLDKKTPLKKSIKLIKEAVKNLEKSLGNNCDEVEVVLGVEQEYFLIKEEYGKNREDILATDRTLIGSAPSIGQELSKHYYGQINSNVEKFMSDLDTELWKLGIGSKTKHNEVTPNQYEIATLFSTANISVDQNYLVMEMIKKVASNHNMIAILNEKPFNGMNGSGKHCNWSIMVNKNNNVFSVGKDNNDKYRFLLYIMAVIESVSKYSNLLRLSTAYLGNDNRLGGYEAPPAIISVFIGEKLEEILNNISNDSIVNTIQNIDEINFEYIKKITKDLSDRNRTSPFAFTGNKFEFRMPGSSQSVSDPTIAMNVIVADVIMEYTNLLAKNDNIKESIIKIIKDRYYIHKKIIFNGDGYSDEWIEESKKRGLENISNTVDIINNVINIEGDNVYIKHNIFSKKEFDARINVYCNRYWKLANIEARTFVNMFQKQIYPSINKYLSSIMDFISKSKNISMSNDLLVSDYDLCNRIISKRNVAVLKVDKILSALERVSNIENDFDKAKYFKEFINPLLVQVRFEIDYIEKIMDKNIYPLPTYFDLLFKI